MDRLFSLSLWKGACHSCNVFESELDHKKKRLQDVPASLGMASFVSVNPPLDFLTLTVPPAPTGTLLSLNRNRGEAKGNITLNPTGLTLGKKHKSQHPAD